MARFITLTIAAMTVLAISAQALPVNVIQAPANANIAPAVAQNTIHDLVRRGEPVSGSKPSDGDTTVPTVEDYNGEKDKKTTSAETTSEPKDAKAPAKTNAAVDDTVGSEKPAAGSTVKPDEPEEPEEPEDSESSDSPSGTTQAED